MDLGQLFFSNHQ